MIEPMTQNKNRYNFQNMKTDNRFRNRFHMLPNMCTCMILDSLLNKSLCTHQSRECCIHEDNW